MANVSVDFNKKIGKLKIMHSVNNVPVGNEVRCADKMNTYDYFRKAHIKYCRSHDAGFYEGYCGEYSVDVHRIFRDFDKDENDEASYDFEYTDKYVQAAEKVGAHVFYRLGASIEHHKKKGTIPPKDFLKWAKICEHIIRHYNEGWANGFKYNLEYWEIWNEPDCRNSDGSNPCWQGTIDEFYDLFCITFKHLKSNFPNLKIGGPSFCNCRRDEYNEGFFSRIKKENITLDFFSFHGYYRNPGRYIEDGEYAYAVLEKYGYEKTTSLILNEWNYVRRWTGDGYIHSIESIKGLKGSSYIAGTMICGQKSKLEHMMYYDARPCTWNGMFDSDLLTPLKGYYPFLIYGEMYENMNTEVFSSSDDEHIYCLASKGRGECALFLTYFDDEDDASDKEVVIDLKNMKKDKTKTIEFRIIDKDNNNDIFRVDETQSENIKVKFNIKPYTTIYIKIKY